MCMCKDRERHPECKTPAVNYWWEVQSLPIGNELGWQEVKTVYQTFHYR